MLFLLYSADRRKSDWACSERCIDVADHPRNHFSCWFFALLVIADKFNRRTLLKIGGSVMGLSFILPAVLGTVLDAHTNSLLILLFYVFMSHFILAHGLH